MRSMAFQMRISTQKSTNAVSSSLSYSFGTLSVLRAAHGRGGADAVVKRLDRNAQELHAGAAS